MNKFQLIFSCRCGSRFARGLAAALFLVATSVSAQSAPLLAHEILATLPHDARDFTQGLAIRNGEMFESTGHHGTSIATRRNLKTGALLQRRELPGDQFGEGLTATATRLVQLTWTSGIAWIYDFSLKRVGQFRYQGEGWGLAFDGRILLMSDGSSRITARDPDTFDVVGGFEVRDGTQPVRRLNELEYADGWLYANIWQSDRIAVIDPTNGAVRGWHDLSSLKRGFVKPPHWNPQDHVLNGIAYDPPSRHFYVTGKCWPVLYRMRFEMPTPQPAMGTARPQ